MKKKTIEDLILLAQSDELAPREREQLGRDLARDPACRAYRADLDTLAILVRERLPAEEASEITVERIRAAAAQAARQKQPTVSWHPAFAYATAALLLLAAGVFYLNRLNRPATRQVAGAPPSTVVPADVPADLAWDAELDAEIEALDEMMAMAFGEADETGTTQESLEDLAEELIELEGIEI